MISVNQALFFVFVMGAVILFCRALPFLFFDQNESVKANSSRRAAILGFVEKTVPPAAMTVLAFNALGGAFTANAGGGFMALAAAAFTALAHIWKGNALISILGGTALYMILQRTIIV
ncbi:MAG: AzlD domain-containing protein [Treponema sp.]|nr:AzlD domain-containing protein [Treponema sp.]